MPMPISPLITAASSHSSLFKSYSPSVSQPKFHLYLVATFQLNSITLLAAPLAILQMKKKYAVIPVKLQWFLTWVVLFPQGCLAICGDLFGCHSWEGATGFQWTEAVPGLWQAWEVPRAQNLRRHLLTLRLSTLKIKVHMTARVIASLNTMAYLPPLPPSNPRPGLRPGLPLNIPKKGITQSKISIILRPRNLDQFKESKENQGWKQDSLPFLL